MANIPITQLPDLSASTSTSLVPVVSSGVTYSITRDNFIPRTFGQYSLDVDQTLSANTATVVNLTNTLHEVGMSLSSNTITFQSGGTYLISASYQFQQGSGSADVAFWFQKNGSPLANSATHQSMSSNSKQTAMVTVIETFSAGHTMNLEIQSTSSNTTIDTIAGSGSIPNAPGVILTISQIY